MELFKAPHPEAWALQGGMSGRTAREVFPHDAAEGTSETYQPSKQKNPVLPLDDRFTV